MKYLFGDPPNPGAVKEIVPGLQWLRMPLPMALDHINLWLIEDGPGWTLVDTGLYSDLSQKLWRNVLDDFLGGRPLNRVICTHFHPDHVGMAGWLVEETGAEFWMAREEWLYARVLAIDTGERFTDAMVTHYHRAGGSPEYLAKLRERGAFFSGIVSEVPRSIQRIRDGDVLKIGGKGWCVVVGNGHAPEHVCLLSRELGLFIAGDLVLPRISPHIGVYADEPDGNPLKDYLETLEKFHTLPDDAIVLPSHNEPFRGLHERLSELQQHHAERLNEFFTACTAPATALNVAKQVFARRLDSAQLGFAIAETIAHLNYLIADEQIARQTDEDGVYLYQRI